MQTIILVPFAPWVLLGIGIFLIALEIVLTSFIVIWFGLGFIVTAFLAYFVNFTEGLWQLSYVASIAIVMMISFRTKMMIKLLDSKDKINEDFLGGSGIGIIVEDKVKFKSIYWDIEQIEDFELVGGEKVFVVSTHNKIAKIKKDK